ncbi:MAG: SRPBCC domain-containing protein [Saprospirales bacterium]|nr:MAG: SRPBCC domain-containing protein [Saprospirales bacterium]
MSREIVTEIEIAAPAERVWQILTDFGNYEHWNPFIVKSEGKPNVGSSLVNTMKSGENKTMTFKPRILKADKNKSLEWRGSLFFRGLFDGHHYFSIESLEENRVKLVHGENFSGLLSGPIFKSIRDSTLQSFEEMNEALKNRCENPE